EPVNRYGQRAASGAAIEDTYAGATVEVRSGQEPYFDTTWGRDEAGRPIKRIDSFGRSMRAGTRVYRVGDRVTPMEWKAYGSLLPENLLREWAAGGGYEPQREYLNYGDLLVGQPRLVLAEFRYDSRRVASGELELWPLGRMITRDGRV